MKTFLGSTTFRRMRGPLAAGAMLFALALTGCGQIASARQADDAIVETRSRSIAPTTTATSAPAQAAAPVSQEIELSGVIQAQNGSIWTISGRTVTVPANAELVGPMTVGTLVRLHATAASGVLVAREIKADVSAAPTTPAATPDVSDDNGVDNPATHDVNDDNGVDNPATHDVNDDNGVDNPATHDVNDDHGVDDPATHDVNDDNGVDNPATHDVNDDHGADDPATHDVNDDNGGQNTVQNPPPAPVAPPTNDDHGGNSGSGKRDDHGGSGKHDDRGGKSDDHGGKGKK